MIACGLMLSATKVTSSRLRWRVPCAGPLLLNALLRHLEQARLARAEQEDGWAAPLASSGGHHAPRSWGAWLPATGSLAYGCSCVALLGLAALLKVLLPPLHPSLDGTRAWLRLVLQAGPSLPAMLALLEAVKAPIVTTMPHPGIKT